MDLEIYYQKIFPSQWLTEWLSYGTNALLHNREFSFTLQGDIYLRFKSYSSGQEFHADLCKLNPIKIDIGPVFNHRPRSKSKNLKPVWRELVIDIDMTDYDPVRMCCSGADICKKCWPLMQVAVKVVDAAMRDDFGFKNLLWIYSGRRGVHLWVCDERARRLDENCRKGIVQYLEVIKSGGEGSALKKVNLQTPLHPHLMRSEDILKDHRQMYLLERQGLMASTEGQQRVLDLFTNDQNIRTQIQAHWAKTESSVQRWLILEKFGKQLKMDQATNEIMFQYMYPRLDAQVSLHLNHLLKSPFCVHPKTGKVCVPFDARKVDEFDPFTVPTLSGLIQQLNDYQATDEVVSDWDKTDMKHYNVLMQEFMKSALEDQQKLAPVAAASKDKENSSKLNF